MNKKLTLIVIILLTISIITGCWDRVEIGDIAIATIAALDKSDDGNIEMTIMFSVPKQAQSGGSSSSSSSSGKKDAITIAGKGNSVMDAYEEIQRKTSRHLFLSHLQVIIIGEKLAKDSVADTLDFFSRYIESRIGKDILFTKGKASEILKAESGLETLLSEAIREELNYNTLKKVSARDFLDMLTEDGKEPMGIAIEKASLSLSDTGNDKEKICKISGIALFHKDKLVGWLDNEESVGIYWLKGAAKLENFSLDIPSEKGGGKVGLRIRNQSTKIKANIIDNEVVVDVYVKSDTVLFSSNSKLDLSDYKSLKYIEEIEGEYVKNLITSSIQKLQEEYKTDITGFGKVLYNKYPKVWREKYKEIWDTEFPKVKVQVITNMHVRRMGFDTKPTTIEEKDFIKLEE